MAEPRKGKRLAVSPARKMVMELLHHARKAPTIPLCRLINIGPLVELREAAQLSWAVLFMKAWALVSRQRPELRRYYIPLPWPHFYEHPVSECAVLVERQYGGENVVLGAKIRQPEGRSLRELDDLLRYFREAPVEDVNYFRQTLRLGRLPWFLRRFTFWQTLNLSGFKRAKRFGTFMISSLGNFGVEQEHPKAPLTTYVTFGPISTAGDVTARVIYDHRVMDGRTVARSLVDLEETLNTTVLAELRSQADGPARAA